MEIVLTILITAVAGFCIGMLSGMLGIGGGLVMVPLLRLGFGLSAYVATATSLFTIIPISLSGAIQHFRNKTCIPKLGVALGIGGAITSPIGVFLALISPAWLIMCVAALVILYSAITMLRKVFVRKPAAHAQAAVEAPAEDAEEYEITRDRLVAGLGIGLVTGVFSGYVGLGGGFIMVPLMTAWLSVPMKKASGTSLIAIMILALPGVLGQAMLGHIDFMAGIMLCVGAIPGAVLGARLVPRIPERALRIVFSALLAFAGVALVLNELHVF